MHLPVVNVFFDFCRFWSLDEALFEVRRLSVDINQVHNSLCSSSSNSPPAVRAVDSLLSGWVGHSSAESDRALKGRVLRQRKTKSGRTEKGQAQDKSSSMDKASNGVSQLWCKACIDDPEVVCCGFCGCKVILSWLQSQQASLCLTHIVNVQFCFGKHDADYLIKCDYCEELYHTYCLTPLLTEIPSGIWHCQQCKIIIEAQSEESNANVKADDHEVSTGEDIMRALYSNDLFLTF